MAARGIDVAIAIGFLAVGLLPLAWPGSGPVVVRVLLEIAAIVGALVVAGA